VTSLCRLQRLGMVARRRLPWPNGTAAQARPSPPS
jgi:hypothetical protein